MKSSLKGNAIKKQNGIISEDVIHKIDMMESESELDQQAYKPRRRKNLDDSQLFDDTVYGSDDSEDSGGSSIVGVIIGVLVAVVAVVILAVVLL